MSEPLFDLPELEAKEQQCNGCSQNRYTTDDALRVGGWLVFDGPSVIGKPLHVRVCPSCQIQKSAKALRSAGLHQEPLPLA